MWLYGSTIPWRRDKTPETKTVYVSDGLFVWLLFITLWVRSVTVGVWLEDEMWRVPWGLLTSSPSLPSLWLLGKVMRALLHPQVQGGPGFLLTVWTMRFPLHLACETAHMGPPGDTDTWGHLKPVPSVFTILKCDGKLEQLRLFWVQIRSL